MDQAQLFPLIRTEVRTILGDYISTPEITTTNQDYILPPALGSQAGVLGAVALAIRAAERQAGPGN
jgi:fructokinase